MAEMKIGEPSPRGSWPPAGKNVASGGNGWIGVRELGELRCQGASQSQFPVLVELADLEAGEYTPLLTDKGLRGAELGRRKGWLEMPYFMVRQLSLSWPSRRSYQFMTRDGHPTRMREMRLQP